MLLSPRLRVRLPLNPNSESRLGRKAPPGPGQLDRRTRCRFRPRRAESGPRAPNARGPVGDQRRVGLDSDDLEHRAIHHLKSLLGLTVDVVVRPPGTFERSTGKAVRVRDLRPKEA